MLFRIKKEIYWNLYFSFNMEEKADSNRKEFLVRTGQKNGVVSGNNDGNGGRRLCTIPVMLAYGRV